jgi:hypothetical protein
LAASRLKIIKMGAVALEDKFGSAPHAGSEAPSLVAVVVVADRTLYFHGWWFQS